MQPAISNQVLYEDNHLIIVNKLPSQIVQGDKTGDEPLSEKIKTYIKKKYGKPGNVFLGVVHRLDRPVSGVVIFARTSKALARLNEALKNRQIKKMYWAVVDKLPPDKTGHLIHYIYRDQKKNKSFIVKKGKKDTKSAELKYNHISSSDRYHLLEIELLTGRHHQIRAQLSYIGCPVKGDLKYNYPRSNKNASIHLHARSVEFIHPVNKEFIRIVADPPKDPLWDYFKPARSK
jgi:23S rRNA pseudouridine1911/1915/1917 synthase